MRALAPICGVFVFLLAVSAASDHEKLGFKGCVAELETISHSAEDEDAATTQVADALARMHDARMAGRCAAKSAQFFAIAPPLVPLLDPSATVPSVSPRLALPTPLLRAALLRQGHLDPGRPAHALARRAAVALWRLCDRACEEPQQCVAAARDLGCSACIHAATWADARLAVCRRRARYPPAAMAQHQPSRCLLLSQSAADADWACATVFPVASALCAAPASADRAFLVRLSLAARLRLSAARGVGPAALAALPLQPPVFLHRVRHGPLAGHPSPPALLPALAEHRSGTPGRAQACATLLATLDTVVAGLPALSRRADKPGHGDAARVAAALDLAAEDALTWAISGDRRPDTRATPARNGGSLRALRPGRAAVYDSCDARTLAAAARAARRPGGRRSDLSALAPFDAPALPPARATTCPAPRAIARGLAAAQQAMWDALETGRCPCTVPAAEWNTTRSPVAHLAGPASATPRVLDQLDSVSLPPRLSGWAPHLRAAGSALRMLSVLAHGLRASSLVQAALATAATRHHPHACLPRLRDALDALDGDVTAATLEDMAAVFRRRMPALPALLPFSLPCHAQQLLALGQLWDTELGFEAL